MKQSWYYKMNPLQDYWILEMGIKILLFSLLVIICFLGMLKVIDGKPYTLTIWMVMFIYLESALVISSVAALFYFMVIVLYIGKSLSIHYTMDEEGIAYEVIVDNKNNQSGLVQLISGLLCNSRNGIYISFKTVDRI